MRKKFQNQFQDELIFFKLFSSSKQEENLDISSEQNKENPIYIFQVSYKNIDFKNINLADTINQNTLVREKIAPRNKWCISDTIKSKQENKLLHKV